MRWMERPRITLRFAIALLGAGCGKSAPPPSAHYEAFVFPDRAIADAAVSRDVAGDLGAPAPDLGPIPDVGAGKWAVQRSGTIADLYSVWGSGAGDVYAVGAGGTILHSTDHGLAWSVLGADKSSDFTGVWGTGPGDAWITGAAGVLALSGTKFATLVASPTDSLTGLWGSSPNDLFASASSGTVYHYTAATGTWMPQHFTAGTSSVDLWAVWGSGPGDVWVPGGALYTLLHSTDDGLTWSTVPAFRLRGGGGGGDGATDAAAVVFSTPPAFRAMWGQGPLRIVVGDNGTIVRSDDGGATWTTVAFTFGAPALRGVWGSGSGVYVVGDGVTVLHSSDAGLTFTTEESGVAATHLRGVWGSAPGDVYIVGDGGLILHQ